MSDEFAKAAEPVEAGPTVSDSEKTLTMVVYGLQAAAFLFVITPLIGIIINYVKRDDVRGTWLESHFRWQMRTFWYGLLWSIIGIITTFIIIGYVVWLANIVWIIYRIAKGWIRLAENKPMYSEP
ncbi:MAG: hypothetical protein MI754_15395 [Chromatiales bacterium]|nr:hypothetical protein [Chromatiales bacterium]